MDVTFVKNILENADDLSVASPELYGKWVDGQTEYHLNPDRANILRALTLRPGSSVLEIGCSSGILSRYLGEQGYNVLAVDDHKENLKVAKIRCESLQNVSFLAGIEEISEVLEKKYDLILLNTPIIQLPDFFLGKEIQKAATQNTREDISSLFSILQNTLCENGVIALMASNRLGLKYWFGSTEENYAKPFIGLWGYGANEQNPREFSYNEWTTIVRKAEIPAHRFLFPFPDHRFADTILSDEFVSTDSHAHSLLYRVKSRDYLAPGWLASQDEYLYWKSLHQSGNLADFTNSFLVLMGNSESALSEMFPYDFIKLSKSQKQSRYHTKTYKKHNKKFVIKSTIREQNEECDSSLSTVSHKPATNEYISGPLLSTLWIDSLVANTDFADFKKLLDSYYQFLLHKLEASEQPGQYLDLLPFNIVVDKSGEYRSFDQEWTINSPISAEFILFRAVLWFCFTHETHISCSVVDEKIANIGEFILFCFQLLNLPVEKLVSKYIELEGQVQHSIDENQSPEQVYATVYQPFQQRIIHPQSTLLETQLFWVTETSSLSIENSVTVKAHIGEQRQTLFFPIHHSAEHIKLLRFDPAAKAGFFHLHRLVLKKIVKETGKAIVLWEVNGSEQIQAVSILEKIHYCPGAMGDLFLSTNEQPQVIIELPESVTAETVNGHFLFEVEIDWPQSSDYLTVIDEIKTQRRELRELREFRELKQLSKENEDYRKHILKLTENVAVLEYKMGLIRKSRLGKIFKLFRV